MSTLLEHLGRPRFPCPICAEPLDVRDSKRRKPYLVCDRCGMQMFLRSKGGINKFNQLVESAETRNIWQRLADLEKQYRVKCPECGKQFWVTASQIATSWFDGRFIGYRCPEQDCRGVVKPEEEQ